MSPSRPSIDWELLQRYHAGEATAAESEQVRQWLAEAPRALALLQAFDRVVHFPAASTEWLDIEQSYAALRERLLHQTGEGEYQRPLRSRPRWRHAATAPRTYRHYGVVAAFVLCVAMGLGWLVTHPPAASPSVAPTQDYATHRGQRATITLADGSTVFLGPESHLRVAGGFGTTSRDVSLTGAGVFTVAHASAAPFVVHAGNTVTQVLGTTFAVRDYVTDSGAQVVVAQGRVMVNRAVILSTGDLVRVTPGGAWTIAHHADIASALEWTQSKLTFDDMPFRDAVPDLERQYDIDIQVTDASIAAHTITASFSTQPTDEVLSELALLLDARVRRHGDTVIFTPARGPRTSDGDFVPLVPTPIRQDIPFTPWTGTGQVAVHDISHREGSSR